MANTKQQLICSRSVGEHIAQIGASPFNDKEPYCGNQVSTKLTMPTNAPPGAAGADQPFTRAHLARRALLSEGRRHAGRLHCHRYSARRPVHQRATRPPQQCADAGDRQNQSGKTGEGLLWRKGSDASEWMMKRDKPGPRYTTSITEIPTVCT